RNRLFHIVKELDPKGVIAQKYRLNRHYGEYIIPRPNYLWLINAYYKLERFSIQIYAVINAYSRYIVWLYCSIIARLGISIVKQYIRIVKALGA
ncbi:hypothetical protein V2W45_1236167, partial [Cenococcum geophilum]